MAASVGRAWFEQMIVAAIAEAGIVEAEIAEAEIAETGTVEESAEETVEVSVGCRLVRLGSRFVQREPSTVHKSVHELHQLVG